MAAVQPALLRALYGLVGLGFALLAASFYGLGIAPLSHQLRAMQERTLADGLATATSQLATLLEQHQDMGRLTASRTAMRQAQIDFLEGALPRSALVSFAQPKLVDAMVAGEDLIGIARFAPDGAFLFAAGVAPPLGAVAACTRASSDTQPTPLPVERTPDGRLQLVYCSPIVDAVHGHVGHDVLIFGDRDIAAFLRAHVAAASVTALISTDGALVAWPQDADQPTLQNALRRWLANGDAGSGFSVRTQPAVLPDLSLAVVVDEVRFFAGIDRQIEHLTIALGVMATAIASSMFIGLRWWVRAVREGEAKLAYLAAHDPLTGLANRRAASDVLRAMWGEAQSEGQHFAVIMVDIDHFKRVNDTHGHEVGDQILAMVGGLCRQATRKGDCWSRYGGEEFLALLPETSLDQAMRIAERLRESVAAARPSLLSGAAFQVTVSCGVASSCDQPGAVRVEDVVNAADHALYAAKRAGRNRTTIAAPAQGVLAAG